MEKVAWLHLVWEKLTTYGVRNNVFLHNRCSRRNLSALIFRYCCAALFIRGTVLQIVVIGNKSSSGHWCSQYWFSPICLYYRECVCWKDGGCVVKYFSREIRASKCWRVASKSCRSPGKQETKSSVLELSPLFHILQLMPTGWEPSNSKCKLLINL